VTRRVALIGQPLRRLHSAVMHNTAFDHFGIDARYELRAMAGDEIPGFVEEARGPDWLGFQVTMPHKQAVMEYLDDIDEEAHQIGAVNSVLRRDDGALAGFNTDAPGFAMAVEDELGVSLSGITAAVAGAGGAARAVVQALLSAGAAEVSVGNRTIARAEALASEFGEPVSATGLGPAFAAPLGRSALAVNATTVGMHTPGAAFDVAALPASAAVYDLVYEPAESEILRMAKERGLRTANGLGMLVNQAVFAFERWTGVTGAGPVMRRAVSSVSPPVGGSPDHGP
jgi:shikimate dehydrogenase